MKKLLIILILFPLLSFSQWEAIGPEGIMAEKIIFNYDDMNHHIICTSDGLWTNLDGEWEHYSYRGMAVRDAAIIENERLVLILGSTQLQSYYFNNYPVNADYEGAYIFNLESKSFEFIHHFIDPFYILFNSSQERYYLGYSQGLYYSEDGISWLPYQPVNFSNTKQTSMDFFNNNMITAWSEYSLNNGATWNNSVNNFYSLFNIWGLYAIQYRKVFYHPNGTLYYLGPILGSDQFSYWHVKDYFARSYNYGHSWDLIFYTQHIYAVGWDILGNTYLGWKADPHDDKQGIAYFDRQTEEVTFVNYGLPNLKINSIIHDPDGDYTNLIVCTDNGVYQNHKPLKVQHYNSVNQEIEVYPNPCSNQITIYFDQVPGNNPINISISNLTGSIVKQEIANGIAAVNQKYSIQTENLKPGVYYLLINMDGKMVSHKFIKSH